MTLRMRLASKPDNLMTDPVIEQYVRQQPGGDAAWALAHERLGATLLSTSWRPVGSIEQLASHALSVHAASGVYDLAVNGAPMPGQHRFAEKYDTAYAKVQRCLDLFEMQDIIAHGGDGRGSSNPRFKEPNYRAQCHEQAGNPILVRHCIASAIKALTHSMDALENENYGASIAPPVFRGQLGPKLANCIGAMRTQLHAIGKVLAEGTGKDEEAVMELSPKGKPTTVVEKDALARSAGGVVVPLKNDGPEPTI